MECAKPFATARRQVISVFIALCVAVILDSGPLPYTSPAVWDPEPASTIRLSVRDPAVLMHRIICGRSWRHLPAIVPAPSDRWAWGFPTKPGS